MKKDRAKKILSILLLSTLVLSTMFSVGCTKTPSSSQPQSQAPDPTQISATLNYFEPHYLVDSNVKAIDATIAAFNKVYPNIKIEIQYVPAADRTAKFIAAMAANQGPDVVCLGNIADYYQFVQSGFLKEMDSTFIAKPDEYWAKFPKNFVDALTIKGKKYGIPYYSGPHAMIYNKAAYAAAGITEFPKTWSEFKIVAKKLTRDTNGDGKIDQYGLTFPSLDVQAPRIFTMFAWSNGGEIIDSNGNPTINSPKCVEALTYLTSLVKEGLVPPGIGETSLAVNDEYFGTGAAATKIEGNWDMAQIPAKYPTMAGNIDAYPMIANDGKTPVSMNILGSYAITTQTKNAEASFAFLNYMMTDECQQLFLNKAGMGPVTNSAIAANKNAPIYGGFIQSLATSKIRPMNQSSTEVDDIIREALQSAYLGKATPQQALDAANEKLKAVLK